MRQFHPFYKQTEIKSVMSSKTYNNFLVTVVGRGAGYCLNLKADPPEHKSKSVYFLVTPYGVQQRCFCTCQGDDVLSKRKKGLCREFKSHQKPLLDEHMRHLFPEHASGGALPPGFLGGGPRNLLLNTEDHQQSDDALARVTAQLYARAFVHKAGKPAKKLRKPRKQ